MPTTEIIPASVTSIANPLLHMIERVARDPSVDIVRLQQLLEMHERITARNAEISFAAAMKAAQAEIRPVIRDKDNSQTRSKYASYYALDEEVRTIYSAHGFALTFDTAEGAPDLFVRVICDVMHTDEGGGGGHTRRYHIDMPADGKGAKGGDVMTRTHATGSAITYGRRNLLLMIFNIVLRDKGDGAVGEDDDGNAASGLLSAAQVKELRTLLTTHNVPESSFLRWGKIDRIKLLPSRHYQKARDVIRNAGQQRAKQ